MKKWVAFLMALFVVLWLVPRPAQAEFWTGNKLYSLCTSAEAFDQALCLGYVTGVHDADEHVYHCSPPTVTVGQIKDIVVKVLREAPEIRDKSADVIVSQTLRALYPCKQQQQKPGVRPITM